MTALEFLKKLTGNGKQVRLPNSNVVQETNSSGGDVVNYTACVCYRSESVGEETKNIRLLEELTLTCINSIDGATFRRMALLLVPKQCKEDPDTQDSWDFLYESLTIFTSNKLLQITINERAFPGSKTMLTILQNRMKAWQKTPKVDIEKSDKEGGSKSVVVTFSDL